CISFLRSFLLLPPMTVPLELPGLRVELDKLVYRHGGEQLPPDRPHAFIYYLTIRNDSDRTVTLLGRKWVVEHSDGTQLVVEGDKIVGETPRLAPGEHFSYNSYHVTASWVPSECSTTHLRPSNVTVRSESLRMVR